MGLPTIAAPAAGGLRMNIDEARPAEPEHWPVIIVGTGAAGMVAAIFAARAGARVLALDSRRTPGAKIRVSGGGRCNVLPSQVALEDYQTSGSTKALRNVLFSWPLPAVVAFFEEELGVPLTVESGGKMFPASGRAKDVVDALLAGMARAGVTLRGEARVTAVTPTRLAESAGLEVRLDDGARLLARRVLLSTGGLSLPKTGSDGGGWRIAARLGHTVLPTHPALVPLLTRERAWHELAGLSLPVSLRAVRDGRVIDERDGDFLFTHAGFSGPAVLDVSRHFTAPGGEAARLRVRWGGRGAPDWEALLRQPEKRAVATLVRQHLPRRLADALLSRAALPEGRTTSELGREERRRLIAALTDTELAVSGSEGYKTAEVTAGGVPLAELSLKTLESRVVPGLHLAGEVLDVTGRIGGFNFLWAWVTGRKAGEALASER